MADTEIEVSLNVGAGAIQFTPSSFVQVPNPTGTTIHTIDFIRQPGESWIFRKLLVWCNVQNEALLEIPNGAVPNPGEFHVFDVKETSFKITGFTDDLISIENINRNETSFNITIHLEVTVEDQNGILYISRDPQVIDEKKPPT